MKCTSDVSNLSDYEMLKKQNIVSWVIAYSRVGKKKKKEEHYYSFESINCVKKGEGGSFLLFSTSVQSRWVLIIRDVRVIEILLYRDY